ncbi:MAG TPA: coiled-coil domain-containing protein [Methylocystis sp.]|nr:coiled-coil domain-containing protein [Methylocystis sp.]
MTQQILFNQFAYADRLKKGGFTDEQARASAEALESALTEVVATKSDIRELRSELKSEIIELRSELKSDISELKSEISELRSELKSDIFRINGDIAELKAEIKAVKTEAKADLAVIRAEIAGNKVDIVRWVLVLNFAMVSVLFAAMKLLK